MSARLPSRTAVAVTLHLLTALTAWSSRRPPSNLEASPSPFPAVPRVIFWQIQFGRVVIPNLTLPGNPGSNLILVTEIEIQFVFPDEFTTDTAAGEHLPPAAQRGVVCHRPPILGSNLT